MSTTPLASPDTVTWPQRITAIGDHLQAHAGQFPDPHSVYEDEARVGTWWVWAQADAVTDDQRADVDRLRRRATELRMAALTAYVNDHDGRFPTNRAADPRVASLGCWWVAQNIEINKRRMPAELADQIEQLRRHAAELADTAKRRRAQQVAAAGQARARAAIAAAGAAGAAAAAEALKSPHLIPGDADVLRLRIARPELSFAELAQLCGITRSKFASKYRGALHRGPNSRSPLRKSPADRVYASGEAADMIGVPRATLSRWADAGLITAQRNSRGHRRYLGAEVLRVRDLIAEGWPEQFTEAARR